MIINLISGPRNISTALMYAFAQRSDTEVADEPFYAVYLTKTRVNHPGREDVLSAQPASEEQVRSALLANRSKPLLFIKNMAHHIEVLEAPLISEAKNIFLIRDPLHILASYSQVIANPTMRDIGLAYQYTLFSGLQTGGSDPIVIDAGILLRQPDKVLANVCRRCGIEYTQRMLHWQPGPKPYDGVWAPYWYVNVHRSTGFEQPPDRSRVLSDHLMPLYHDARMYYEKLLPFSIKA